VSEFNKERCSRCENQEHCERATSYLDFCIDWERKKKKGKKS